MEFTLERKKVKGRKSKKNERSGNRTHVFCLEGRNNNHYTIRPETN